MDSILGGNNMEKVNTSNKSISMNTLINTMSIFETLYDVIRVVNPVKKQLLDLKLNKVNELESSCYNLWRMGKVCSNCVSGRAIMKKKLL